MVDIIVRDGIHMLEYGQSFSSVSPQAMAGIITELLQKGAIKQVEATTSFVTDPSIYRLYYMRYYDTLVRDQRRQRLQLWINCALAISAVASAFFAGYSARKSHIETKADSEKVNTYQANDDDKADPCFKIVQDSDFLNRIPERQQDEDH